jgi:hypothetical protein
VLLTNGAKVDISKCTKWCGRVVQFAAEKQSVDHAAGCAAEKQDIDNAAGCEPVFQAAVLNWVVWWPDGWQFFGPQNGACQWAAAGKSGDVPCVYIVSVTCNKLIQEQKLTVKPVLQESGCTVCALECR